MRVEVCVDSIASAIAAAEGGKGALQYRKTMAERKKKKRGRERKKAKKEMKKREIESEKESESKRVRE